LSNEVYANGRELSCKSGSGKTVAAFPDVCFTPPQTPATPPGVPVPYPNNGMSSDCTDGSTSVKISGAEVMLKDKSYFRRSSGDEAGCAPKKGVVTSTNRGKVYFKAWSMDVKIEGENAVRHLDITTHNHACEPGQTPPFPHVDGMVLPAGEPECEQSHDELAEEADNLPKNMSRLHEDAVTRRESSTIAGAYRGRSPPATTLAVGMVVGAGPPKFTPAHSRSNLGKARKERFAKGMKNPGTSGAAPCGGGAPHQYAQDQTHHRHAEAKLIEDWAASGAPGMLVLNVSRPVCENCAALIRNVNCNPAGKPHCNKVFVCDQNQSDEAKERLKCP
jgi:hypothetical protein